MHFLALAFLSLPAFAAWTYQPAGRAIPVQQAAARIAAGEAYRDIVVTQGRLFVEFGEGDTAAYARAGSVADFENAIGAAVPVRTVVSGKFRYLQGWNKLYLQQGSHLATVYNVFDQLRQDFQDMKSLPPIEDEADSRDKMIHTYLHGFELLSLAGPDVTFFERLSGYGGGAHGYAWAGMKHRNFGHKQDSLLDLVENQALLDQLKANPMLRLQAAEKGMLPQLDAVTQLTDFNRLAPEITDGPGSVTRWSEEDQWLKFSIWDYDPATRYATIRLGLEYYYEAARGAFTQLEVLVPVTSNELADALAAVKTGATQGQFLKDVPEARQPPRYGRVP